MFETSVLYFALSIGFLLLFSAFFSGSETGLTSVSLAKIYQQIKAGNKRAKTVGKLRKDKDRLIGAILLGNNAVNILASALATALAIKYYGDDGVYYATIIMTALVLIFAEVLPKTYAFRNAEKVALLVAPIFTYIVRILAPITGAVQVVVDFVLRLFGVRPVSDEDHKEVVGTDALRGSIHLHHHEGAVMKTDRDMLDSILDMDNTDVEEIMIHRRQMETISLDQKPGKIIKEALQSPHTRIPVWKDNPENITGILHAKRLLLLISEKSDKIKIADIESILTEPWFVPESTSIKSQMYAFLEKKTHIALVVDEYGALLGMVTLEDILEEIVGQIEDEYDDETRKDISEEKDGVYVVDGSVTIRDINRELDWNLPDDEANTVAGLVIHEAESIPDTGQVFHFHGYRFEIFRKQRNQITSIGISKIDGDEEED